MNKHTLIDGVHRTKLKKNTGFYGNVFAKAAMLFDTAELHFRHNTHEKNTKGSSNVLIIFY